MGDWGGGGEAEIFGPATYLTPRGCGTRSPAQRPLSPDAGRGRDAKNTGGGRLDLGW